MVAWFTNGYHSGISSLVLCKIMAIFWVYKIDLLTNHAYYRLPCHWVSVLNFLKSNYRGIAQSGSAPALGAGCREFESLYPDQILTVGY